MSDLELVVIVGVSWILGWCVGYVLWAPDTPFKQAFVHGLSFKFIWGRWVK